MSNVKNQKKKFKKRLALGKVLPRGKTNTQSVYHGGDDVHDDHNDGTLQGPSPFGVLARSLVYTWQGRRSIVGPTSPVE